MVNPNKLQKDNLGALSAKTSLSDLRPRLSMKAAAGNAKINQEALNLIQKQQQPEEEQGKDLIQSLTQFVGPDGLIKDSVDVLGYAELMQCESSSSHQILLLKILVATLKNDSSFSERLIQCEGILLVLGLWLSSVEPEKLCESPMIEKLLEILSRLPFTVDLLVKHKYGRVIKKITQQQGKTTFKNYEMAVKLFEDWSVLANKSETPTIIRRKSEDTISIAPVSETQHSVEPFGKQQSTLKRSLSDEENERQKVKIPRKRSVSFPDTQDKLCKVIIFEREPEEYEFLSDGSAARDNYLHADAGEASLAFGSSDEFDGPFTLNFKPWTGLQPIEGLPDIDRPEGIDSDEKIIQQQRERSVLSINYYSFSDIPPNPSEAEVDEVSDDSFTAKTIISRANESILKRSVSIKSTLAPNLVVPSELLTNFMTNNSRYTAMLNPFVTSNTNAMYESMPLGQNFYENQDTFGYDTQEYKPTGKNYNVNRFKKSRGGFGNYNSSHGQRGHSSKTVCHYYRAGLKNSCNNGSKCKFLHQD